MSFSFASLFERLYGRAPSGTEPARFMAAEKRLGVSIPEPLVRFHAECGAERVLMSAHNRLLSPSKLVLGDGRIVFAEENQGACVWGCGAGDDPDVEVLIDGPGEAWFSEACSLSRFLEVWIWQQTAWGGYPVCAHHFAPKKVDLSAWEICVEHNGLTIWKRNRVLISLLDGDDMLIASAPTEADLTGLSELGFEGQ